MTEDKLFVSKTILEQLGGQRFLVMTGSHTFTGSENALTMRLRRNAINATHLRITLTPADTYTMEFMRVRGSKVTTVKTYEDVYNEDLQRFFTDATGLFTSLGTMGR